jgi:hypothetical protein
MAAEESKQITDRPKRHVVSWFLAQTVVTGPWILPWLTTQYDALTHGRSLGPPSTTEAVPAAVAIAFTTFAIKIWKEVEADAIKGGAAIVRAFPHAAKDLLGRAWDASCVALTFWGFGRRYLLEIRYRYGLFNDKGLGLINANRLDLDKVYVELKASNEVNLKTALINPLSREIRERAPLWEHMRAVRSGFGIVIVGAPGSGKTTLLQHVLLSYARGRQWRHRMRFRMPIFIELRKVAVELAKNLNVVQDLPDIIEAVWKNDPVMAAFAKNVSKDWLLKRLRNGRCLLLWDGLDEVADTNLRMRVRDWVTSNAIESPHYRSNVSIISARPAGYRSAPLERAQVLEVQPFEWEDTKLFIRQWYNATEAISSKDKSRSEVRRRAYEESQSLLICLQDMPKLADLSVNPLLLTMICMVHRYHGALPGSRSQLYDEICQVLLERWRQQRGMRDTHSSNQKLEILRELAAWMMQERVKDINQEDMLAIVSDPLIRIGVSAGREAAIEFMYDLRDSSGLWLEREAGIWAFAHLSFQEHLCADAWVRNAQKCPARWSDMLIDSWWRESLLLYATKATDASPLANAALDGNTTSKALALQLLDEKINLAAAVRARMECALTVALMSREQEVFVPAAEAWLIRQQEKNFHYLTDDSQISDLITQSEFQIFLLMCAPDVRAWSTPLHWKEFWFRGEHDNPVSGVSIDQSRAFCEWLNGRFAAWKHRLPKDQAEQYNNHANSLSLQVWLDDKNEPSSHLAPAKRRREFKSFARQKKSSSCLSDIRLIDFSLDTDIASNLDLVLQASFPAGLRESVLVGAKNHMVFALALVLDKALDIGAGPSREKARRAILSAGEIKEATKRDVKDFTRVSPRSRVLALARMLSRAFHIVFGRLPAHEPTEVIYSLGNAIDLQRVLELVGRREHQDESKFNLRSLAAELAEIESSIGVKDQRRIRCLRELLPAMFTEADYFAKRSALRKFIASAFWSVRDYDVSLMTTSFKLIEAANADLIRREDDEVAIEGIQVVRVRRK